MPDGEVCCRRRPDVGRRQRRELRCDPYALWLPYWRTVLLVLRYCGRYRHVHETILMSKIVDTNQEVAGSSPAGRATFTGSIPDTLNPNQHAAITKSHHW